MAALPTIPQTITIGDATIYLMSLDVSKGQLFGAKLAKQTTPILINYVTDALRWEYESFPNNDTLRGTSNYLLWLCGKYKLEAQGLNGGGTVIPIDPALLRPNPIEFVVGASSEIPTGSNSLSIPSFIGYNLIFVRNNITQSTIDTGSSYFTWNRVTGAFTCVGAANEFELFQFYPTA